MSSSKDTIVLGGEADWTEGSASKHARDTTPSNVNNSTRLCRHLSRCGKCAWRWEQGKDEH